MVTRGAVFIKTGQKRVTDPLQSHLGFSLSPVSVTLQRCLLVPGYSEAISAAGGDTPQGREPASSTGSGRAGAKSTTGQESTHPELRVSNPV